MDAPLATALDIDLAAAFDVADLLFPVRARFIAYSQPTCWLAYALHMARSRYVHLGYSKTFLSDVAQSREHAGWLRTLLKGFALFIVYAVVLEVAAVGVFTYAVMQL
jgi:hypothetical protein